MGALGMGCHSGALLAEGMRVPPQRRESVQVKLEDEYRNPVTGTYLKQRVDEL